MATLNILELVASTREVLSDDVSEGNKEKCFFSFFFYRKLTSLLCKISADASLDDEPGVVPFNDKISV